MTDQPLQKFTSPLPANEPERLAALHRYNILDTPPEAAFDRITKLAARLFNMPIALISLVDESRAWFKSCVGFGANEVPRDNTLCSFAVLADEPLIVPDTRRDDRFVCNPFVQAEPGVRFYAGAPLISQDGFNLGTLCLLDSQPRDPLTAEQQATLVDLGAMVVDELELRLAAQKIAQSEAKYKQAESDLRDVYVQLETALAAGAVYTYRWHIPDDRLIVSAAFADLFNVDVAGATTTGLPIEQFINSIHAEDRPRIAAALEQAIATGDVYLAEHRVQTAAGEEHWVAARGQVEFDADGSPLVFIGAIADITERKQTEAALQESESQLKLALKIGKLGSWQLDLKTYELLTSEQCKVNFGLSSNADFSHQVLFNRMHPDDRAWIEAAIQQAIEQHTDYDVEYRNVWDDGSIHWVLVRGCTFYDSNGTPLHMIGMSLDITDRKQAEAAIQESEAQSRNILESITDAFCALDEHWRFTYINRAAETLLDRTPEDLIGQSIWEAYPGLSESEFGQLYWRAMLDRVAGSTKAFYPDHDRWYESHVYPATQGITIYFRNVTEQIQAQAALRQSEERYRTLFESIDQGFCVIEVLFDETNQPIDYYFLEINPAFEKQTGLINAQGKRMRELAPNHEAHWFEIYGNVALTGEPIRFENRAAALHRWYDVYAFRIGQPDDKKVAILFNDITERVRVEDERKQVEDEREQLLQREQAARAEAERANRIKDEFLAVLSHELRSPLNPILGWTRLLQTGRLDKTRQRDALATIERNAKLQTQLIEDLLDISRILQGKLSLTAAPVNLAFVISAALETVRLAAEAKHIQITLDLDPNLALIPGDAARLQQVVWNLLTNAVKFTPQGGQVTIALRQIEQLAQIRITDTGKGIAADFLPHVFEYFRQQDGSTTRTFGGLGLGLAIVRQIVEMHGGTVWAESRGENQGATFTVQLPVLPQIASISSEPSSTQAHTEAPLDNVRILLVDDDTDTREFQAFLLEQSGANVTAVASGSEALQLLDQLIPDVMISDVGMAEMDGYMLIEQIRSRPPNRGGTIPTIALTAYAAEHDRQRALKAGFQMHLTKPLEPKQFISAIVSLLKSIWVECV